MLTTLFLLFYIRAIIMMSVNHSGAFYGFQRLYYTPIHMHISPASKTRRRMFSTPTNKYLHSKTKNVQPSNFIIVLPRLECEFIRFVIVSVAFVDVTRPAYTHCTEHSLERLVRDSSSVLFTEFFIHIYFIKTLASGPQLTTECYISHRQHSSPNQYQFWNVRSVTFWMRLNRSAAFTFSKSFFLISFKLIVNLFEIHFWCAKVYVIFILFNDWIAFSMLFGIHLARNLSKRFCDGVA